MIYNILDDHGNVINTVIANAAFMEAHYPGHYALVGPAPAPPPPGPPTLVTARQARLALRQAGKLAAVDLAIAALPSPQKEVAEIEWQHATEVRRDWPLVQALAPALGLNGAALDELFAQAATL